MDCTDFVSGKTRSGKTCQFFYLLLCDNDSDYGKFLSPVNGRPVDFDNGKIPICKFRASD